MVGAPADLQDPPRPRWPKSAGVHAAALAVYLVLFALESADNLSRGFDIPPRKDAHQYVTLAYNLERYGVYSLGMADDPAQRAPTAYRPPAYPALLAVGIRLSPQLGAMSWEQFLRKDSQPRLWSLKAIHVALLLATSLVAMAIVRDTTGSVVASYACLFLVGLDPSLQRMNQTFVSEPLATFLLTAFSFCMVRVVRGGGLMTFAAAGVSLALLALTRAAFQCFWLLAGILLLALAARGSTMAPDRRRLRVGAAIMLACYFPLVGAWMGRNLKHTGRFFLSEGGGIVLAMRAELNMMSKTEYAASFLLWTNFALGRRLLPRVSGEEPLPRLAPDDREGGVDRLADARRAELEKRLGSRVLADKVLSREALGRMLSHPVRHALVTIPIAHRGLYVEGSPVAGLMLFAGFLAALGQCWTRRDPALAAALLPAAAAFAFHSLLTHNIPRYNEVLLPVMWAGATVVVGSALGLCSRPPSPHDPRRA